MTRSAEVTCSYSTSSVPEKRQIIRMVAYHWSGKDPEVKDRYPSRVLLDRALRATDP